MNIPRPSWRVFFAGILAGAVDAAPSISGATVYYVVGVYQYLLISITRAWDSLFAAFRTRSFTPIFNESAWKYLLVLKSGVILSFLSFAHTILLCLQTTSIRPFLFSLFFGFVLGSALLCLQRVHAWTKLRALLFVLGIGFGLFIIHAPPLFPESRCSVPVISELPAATNVSNDRTELLHVPVSAIKYIKEKKLLDETRPLLDEATSFPIDLTENLLALPFRPQIVLTGLIVASAMLLPGVSGSYVLNVLGYYSTVLSAILEVISGILYLTFPLEAWELLLNLGIGVLLGIICLSKAVLRLFNLYPCATQSLLAGIMLGSLACLWPFQELVSIVDPFHIGEGMSLTCVGRYMPSVHESIAAWHIFAGITLSFSGVFMLQKLSSNKFAEEQA